MEVVGQVSDKHGRALRNVFEVDPQDLLLELSTGVLDPADFVLTQDSATEEFIRVPVADFLSGSGSVTDGANVGGGAGQVFKVKVGNDLQFRTIASTPSVNAGISGDTVVLDVLGAGVPHPTLAGLAWSVAGHTIDTHFLPNTDAVRDLGSLAAQWRALYLGDGASGGLFIRTNAYVVGTGASPPISTALPTISSDLLFDIQSQTFDGSEDLVTFHLSGGQFLTDIEWDMQASAAGDFIRLRGNVIPRFNNTYNLGDSTRRWFGVNTIRLDVDGAADVVQANIQGAAGQVVDIFVVELSTGADLFTVDPAQIQATRQLMVDGGTDEIQLLVQGAAGQTANLITAETSAGLDVFTVSAAGITTAEKFIVNEVDIATKDNYLSQFNINATANDTSVYQGAFLDIDYSQNGAGAFHATTTRGINIDIDFAHTATAFSGHTIQFMKGTIDAASAVGVTGASGRVFELTATINNTGYSASSGAYLMDLIGNASANLICLKTNASNAGSGLAMGYQGSATALVGATGGMVGIEGFVTSVNTVARIVAVSALPRGSGSFPANDKVLSFKGASGHWLCGSGSLAVLTTTPADLSTVSTTHLNFVSNTGELYVQGALEVDGKIWADGDLEMADNKDIVVGSTNGTVIATATTQKLAFWNAAPVVQPSAYTQTYATATKTHANLTSATLTDSSGGTANTTVAAVAAGVDLTTNATINDNFADVVAQINALRVDLENTKQVLNAVIDDDQSIGIKG